MLFSSWFTRQGPRAASLEQLEPSCPPGMGLILLFVCTFPKICELCSQCSASKEGSALNLGLFQ